MPHPPNPQAVDSADLDVPLWRLYLLRANFLVWAVAGCFLVAPMLSGGGRGMNEAMMAGLWGMSILGLRYPLKMLPIFLFEFAWKTIWLAAFGLPQWFAGSRSERLSEDLLSIGTGPILFGLVIPWTYVWRKFVVAPSDRWRSRR